MTMCQLISDLKIIIKNLRFTLVLNFVSHSLNSTDGCKISSKEKIKEAVLM